MPEAFPADQDKQVKKLKRRLEGWRVALLPLKSVLLWEESWHPALIFGVISTLYFVIWLLDPNILTMVASLGMVASFVDFVVPMATSHLVSPASWTGQQEKMFEEMCKVMVTQYNAVRSRVASFYGLRETKPVLYYVLTVSFLLVLLWLGKYVNNTHLFYFITLALALTPGLTHRGIPSSIGRAVRGTGTGKID